MEIDCPFCKGKLTVDPETGAIIHAEPPPRERQDFETVLGELATADQRREEMFRKAFKSESKRNEILEKKFEKAKEKAEEDPAKKRFNPMDYD